jgi:NADH-quinone oxidoreductase subunit J
MLEIFYSIFFAITLLSALMVVFSRHSVHSALFLVVTMISIAGLFILINAQFAAVLQIIVYAGAIMVLFIFVIMLLNLGMSDEPPLQTRFIRRIAVVAFVLFLVQSGVLAWRFAGDLAEVSSNARFITISEIAVALLTRYIYAFEMTSIMLLIAVIGAMVLARRRLASLQPSTGEDHA